MPDGRITHTEREGVHVLRYAGRIDYTLAIAIDRLLETLLRDGSVAGLVFDLRQANLVDSTNLGLLARLAERVRGRGGNRAVIVSTNEDVTDVLRSMGFEEIFDIVADDPVAAAAGPGEEISFRQPSQDELMRTMLHAHRALVTLNDKDRAEFQDVVTWLEGEVGHFR